jgi:hypothetical protein
MTLQWGFYEPSSPSDPALAYTRKLDTWINRKSDIIHWFVQWNSTWDATFAQNSPWLATVKGYGATPLITWEAWAAPLKDIIAGKWDAYIDSWAQGLAIYAGPIMLRPLHEADYTGANAYPWSLGFNPAADIIAAFRHIHDRFVLAKATNVQFVWAVNVWSPAGNVQESLFPGDAYVDWVGIDIYNWAAQGGSPWSSLAAGLTAGAGGGIYARLAALSTKPLMLPEWASPEPSGVEIGVYTKGQWIKDAATALATQFPRIMAAIWFSKTATTWALDSSPDSLAGAKAAFGSPPPPPAPPPVDPVLTAIANARADILALIGLARADVAKVQATLDRIFK